MFLTATAACTGDDQPPPDPVPTTVAELSMSEALAEAAGSTDPQQAMTAAFADNGFEASTADCIATSVLAALGVEGVPKAAQGLEGEFLFDGEGLPRDDAAWTMMKAVMACSVEESAGVLTAAALSAEASNCIARASAADEGVAVALTLYSSSIRSTNAIAAEELAQQLLERLDPPVSVGADESPAARLLVARSSDCVAVEDAAQFLAAER
jgi:hypothetical protein